MITAKAYVYSQPYLSIILLPFLLITDYYQCKVLMVITGVLRTITIWVGWGADMREISVATA
jgi:hypothetical protein